MAAMLFRHAVAPLPGPDAGGSSLSRLRCASALAVSVGFVFALVAILDAGLAAQTRRSQPPLQQATRALLEGRYDEVDQLTRRSTRAIRTSWRSRRGRPLPAAATPTPKRCCARRSTRAPASAAALELGLLAKMLGRSDATPILRAVADAATGSDRRGARPARARRVRRSQRRVPERRRRRRRRIRRSTRPGASCTSTRTRTPTRWNCSQAALEGDQSGRRRCSAPRRRWPTTIRRRRSRPRRRRSRSTRRTSRPTCSSPARRWIRTTKTKRAKSLQKALDDQPVEPRGARRPGGDRLRRGQDRGVRRRGRQGARHLARRSAKSTASPAS